MDEFKHMLLVAANQHRKNMWDYKGKKSDIRTAMQCFTKGNLKGIRFAWDQYKRCEAPNDRA